MSGAYLTIAELKEAPTGIDWSALPESGASTGANTAALTNIINRATGWVDRTAHQKLQATTDTETWIVPGLRARYTRRGTFSVFPENSPIVAVSSVRFSVDGVTFTALPWTPRITNRAKFELLQPTSWSWSGQGYGPPVGYDGWLQYVYTNGYANALLTGSVNAGGTSLVVDDPTGITPGQVLTLYDGVNEEQVKVAAGYVAGSTTVPLAAGTTYAHAAGVRLSALPDCVREAMLLVCQELAKGVGVDTMQMTSDGRAVPVAGGSRNLDNAAELLEPVKRVL